LAFGAKFISSWIRIRIWSADPDPGDKFNPVTDPDPKHWFYPDTFCFENIFDFTNLPIKACVNGVSNGTIIEKFIFSIMFTS
jgi:hypothetical protein